MWTARRSIKLIDLARSLLLGTLLAVGIGVAAGAPELAWMGYALAALDPEARTRRACLPRSRRGLG